MDFLHFCPEDGWFGDAMPLYAEGVYHIYYTKLYKDKPMSWGHILTRDLVHYTECVDPFPPGAFGTPCNTGCVYYKDKKYYAFYAVDNGGEFAMYRAESDDGMTFSYPGTVCFERPKDIYRQDDTWRDPAVMYDAECGVYRMVFCAKIPERDTPNCTPGVVGQAISKDLINWECLPPLSLRGVARSIECPDLMKQNGRYYLGYYWHETRFRSADSIDGEWQRGDTISPDHFDFMAAKQLFDGKRRILFGWLPRKNCDCSERVWGGNMLIPRELSFDGKTPKTRFVSELDEWFTCTDDSFAPAKATVCTGEWSKTADGFVCDSHVGGSMVSYKEMPQRCRIRFDFEISDKGCLTVTLCAHNAYTTDNEYLDMGYDLMFDAADGMLKLREHYMWDQRGDIAVIPCSITPGQIVRADVVYDNGILEVATGEQTMVCRLTKPSQGGLAFTVEDAKAKISNFKVNI